MCCTCSVACRCQSSGRSLGVTACRGQLSPSASAASDSLLGARCHSATRTSRRARSRSAAPVVVVGRRSPTAGERFGQSAFGDEQPHRLGLQAGAW